MTWGGLKERGRVAQEEVWAASDLLFGLEALRDEEGRPIGERRAPSSSKVDVPMVLKECPYHDERNGMPMNVSALTQLTKHLEAVLADMSAFRTAQNAEVSWLILMEAVVDQLLGPGRFVLTEGMADGKVSAKLAVGHKLAAGYFGVLKGLLQDEIRGHQQDLNVDFLLDYISRNRSLIGASEVCGGPPVMIKKVTSVLFGEGWYEPFPLDPVRAPVARLLAKQVRLGVAWELYDLACEYALLRIGESASHLHPRNSFIGTKLAARVELLSAKQNDPGIFGMHVALAKFLQHGDVRKRASIDSFDTHEKICDLVLGHNGAIDANHDFAETAATIFVDYVRMATQVISAQEALEREIRAILKHKEDARVHLNAHLLPSLRAGEWMEAILGLHLERSSLGQMRLAQAGRPTVELAI